MPITLKPKIGDNWKVVVLAVLAATIFWFFNSLNKNYEVLLSYPISFNFARDSVIVVEPLPKEMRIDVSSGGWNLLRKVFWFSIAPIVIPLPNPTEVKYLTRSTLFDITKEQLTDITLNRVMTDTIFISVEPRVQKKVKTVVDSLAIPLEKGYQLTSPISYQPDSVVVMGPSSLMTHFPATWLLELDKEELIDGNFNESITVPLTDSKLMSAQPAGVQVSFSAEKFMRDSVLVKIHPANFPERFRGKMPVLRDTTLHIHYTIRQAQARQVADTSFSVAADFKMLNKADSTIVPVVLYLPAQAFDVEIEPDRLKISYEDF